RGDLAETASAQGARVMDSIFANLPRSTATDEQFSDLLKRPDLRIERIVSTGQCSPPGFWYDQPDGEWVLLIQGEARLRLADEAAARHLKAGDFVDIAPHRRHRVDWTTPEQPTIWLAIHYSVHADAQ
ncbi:MAG: cupin domain-containing protein, partial [Azonexus sp.]